MKNSPYPHNQPAQWIILSFIDIHQRLIRIDAELEELQGKSSKLILCDQKSWTFNKTTAEN